MPNNTFLLLGLGLAAWMFLRNNGQVTEETDLVDASMLSQGTGRTGAMLADINTVTAEVPINEPQRDSTVAGFDLQAWLASIMPAPPAAKKLPPKVVNEDLPNVKTGPEPTVSVTPFVQTPEYIRTKGELAGTAVRQFGLLRDVDLLNDKIYIQQIEVEEESSGPRITGPITPTENVQIVAGGANPGDPYYTSLDVLIAAKEAGYFTVPTLTGAEASARSNVFDVEANRRYLASVEENVTVTGGVPLTVSPAKPRFQIDRYDIDTAQEF